MDVDGAVVVMLCGSSIIFISIEQELMGGNESNASFTFVCMPKEASEWSRNAAGLHKNRLVLMPLEVWF